MSNFRSLCNELHNALYQCDWPDGEKFYALAERARIALKETEQHVPTKEEAVALYSKIMVANEIKTLGDMAEQFAHAVLKEWGQ